MSYWASRRKLSYISIFLVVLFIGIALPTYYTVYKPPTCYDHKQNQKELGVDCGGPCSILCKAQALKPVILWQRAFKVTPGVYNAVAYIENPNLDSGAKNVSYRFGFYDEKGILIYEREGKTDIAPNKIFPIFEDRIETKERVPSRVTFEIISEPVWEIDTSEPLDVRVGNQSLTEDSFPRVLATVENRSITPLYKLGVVAIVYDSNDNAVATSRTLIDKLDKDSSEKVVFTWPNSIDFGKGVCEKPADVVMVLDRSGSMDDDGLSPPEPLTSVKNAAQSFIGNLKERDRAGVVSFATTVRDPIDELLSADFENVKKVISGVVIGKDGSQNTNIGEGIAKAVEELSSNRHRAEAKPVVVLLTDGIPSHPTLAGDPKYAEKYAVLKAGEARDKKIDLYIIGLGKKVDGLFLRNLASRPELYFEASGGDDLVNIYQDIATEICKKGPTKIQIIPLVP